MLGLLIKIGITNFLFGLPLLMLGAKHNVKQRYNTNSIAFLAFAAAPAITALLLYYLYLLLPGYSDGLYFGIIVGVFVAIGVYARSGAKVVTHFFRSAAGWLKRAVRPSFGGKGFTGSGVQYFLSSETVFLLMTAGLVAVWLYLIVTMSIASGDYLQYGTQGKIFHAAHAVVYQSHQYDAASGFYFVGLHGFSVPLLAAWELTINQITGLGSDAYFESLTGYYALLLVVFIRMILQRESRMLAFYGVTIVVLTYGFQIMFYSFHIDMLRILLLSVSLYFMVQTVRIADRFSVMMWGVFGGLAANVHSIGVMLFCMSVVVVFFFMNGNVLKKRLPTVVTAGILALLFGGIHYVLDVFIGTGWIFKEIKFY